MYIYPLLSEAFSSQNAPLLSSQNAREEMEERARGPADARLKETSCDNPTPCPCTRQFAEEICITE